MTGGIRGQGESRCLTSGGITLESLGNEYLVVKPWRQQGAALKGLTADTPRSPFGVAGATPSHWNGGNRLTHLEVVHKSVVSGAGSRDRCGR